VFLRVRAGVPARVVFPPVPPVLAGDTARQYSTLLHPYVAVLAVAFVIVTLAYLVAMVRFRARTGCAARPTRDHHVLTAIYVAILVVAAIGLSVGTIRAEDRVDAVSSHPSTTIAVLAAQWRWSFIYPGGLRSHTLVVPAGEEIEFRLRSQDVIHSMFIPSQRFKRYAYPDRTNVFDLRFDRTGSFLGECAQFCGWNHAYMRFVVRVLPRDQFDAWAASHAGALG
jgi:cytochrome c oxidase subunit II